MISKNQKNTGRTHFEKGNHPISEFKKGHIPWNKGKKLGYVPPMAFKKGMVSWNKGGKAPWAKNNPQVFKKGYTPWSTGKKLSEKHVENLRRSHIGQKGHWAGKKRSSEDIAKMRKAHLGKIRPIEERKKISDTMKKIVLRGKDSPYWNGGNNSEDHKIRMSFEYRLWRESVFKRDGWICQKCRIQGGKIIAHHIQNFSKVKELRTSIENGITFCQNCHKEFHRIYGNRNNNQEQIKEF